MDKIGFSFMSYLYYLYGCQEDMCVFYIKNFNVWFLGNMFELMGLFKVKGQGYIFYVCNSKVVGSEYINK